MPVHVFQVLVYRAQLSWFGALMTVSEVLALLTIPSVLLRRQGQPRAALSWLLALFALPAVGVGCWWLFGRTSMARKRRRRVESTSAFDTRLSPAAQGDSIFTSKGNQVDLLFDGGAAFPAMEAAVRAAERTVHV